MTKKKQKTWAELTAETREKEAELFETAKAKHKPIINFDISKWSDEDKAHGHVSGLFAEVASQKQADEMRKAFEAEESRRKAAAEAQAKRNAFIDAQMAEAK